MDTIPTLTVKGFPLFIEPSALEVSDQLECYRRIIARFASNIWWHLTLCRPLGIKTVIKAYTFSGETTEIKLPYNITLTKVATHNDFPTFDSVVKYSIELFKQMLDLHSAPFRVVKTANRGIIHYDQTVWMLDISGQNAKSFWFRGLETDEEYADSELIHAGMSNKFIDKSIADSVVHSVISIDNK